ncbi:hypothetical protein LEMLEM_LOCUS13779, partial [Lemmus lemmus]
MHFKQDKPCCHRPETTELGDHGLKLQKSLTFARHLPVLAIQRWG